MTFTSTEFELTASGTGPPFNASPSEAPDKWMAETQELAKRGSEAAGILEREAFYTLTESKHLPSLQQCIQTHNYIPIPLRYPRENYSLVFLRRLLQNRNALETTTVAEVNFDGPTRISTPNRAYSDLMYRLCELTIFFVSVPDKHPVNNSDIPLIMEMYSGQQLLVFERAPAQLEHLRIAFLKSLEKIRVQLFQGARRLCKNYREQICSDIMEVDEIGSPLWKHTELPAAHWLVRVNHYRSIGMPLADLATS